MKLLAEGNFEKLLWDFTSQKFSGIRHRAVAGGGALSEGAGGIFRRSQNWHHPHAPALLEWPFQVRDEVSEIF